MKGTPGSISSSSSPERNLFKNRTPSQTHDISSSTTDGSTTPRNKRFNNRWMLVPGLSLVLAAQMLVGSSYGGTRLQELVHVSDVALQRQASTDPTTYNAAFSTRVSSSRQETIPLEELTRSHERVKCSQTGFRPVPDTIIYQNNNNNNNATTNRNIPRIIHVTSKDRCMPERFFQIIDQWRFEGYSLYFHDDTAVDRLLYGREWPEFPLLRSSLNCLVSGAAKADMWRGLVLYEYGGVYTDIDNTPAPGFANGTAISDTDQAWFPIEKLGVLAQFFMAAQPKHPLMWLLVQHTSLRLLTLPDVESQYVPAITGPGALKVAFMEYNGVPPGSEAASHRNTSVSFQRVTAGVYHGRQYANTSTVTVVGDKRNAGQYVHRGVVRNKANLYEGMGMKHFSRMRGPSGNESCVQRVYHKTVVGGGGGGVQEQQQQ